MGVMGSIDGLKTTQREQPLLWTAICVEFIDCEDCLLEGTMFAWSITCGSNTRICIKERFGKYRFKLLYLQASECLRDKNIWVVSLCYIVHFISLMYVKLRYH